MGISLKDWVDKNGAEDLQEDIKTHISVMGDYHDVDYLTRLIMISVRQFIEQKKD